MRLPGSPGSLFFDIRESLMWSGGMRPLILISSLALAACGGNGPANTAAASEGSAAEGVSAVNDITAIDAATGEAADMAADVNYTFNEVANNTADNNAAGNSAANSSD